MLIEYAHTSCAVLGHNFVGLYLLGSLAVGDFDLTSDVDFMIVTKSELSHGEVELVQDTDINVSQTADPHAFERTVAFIAYTTRLAEEYQLPKH